MKKTILLIMLAFIGWSTATAQVGIGTTTPNASAILDIDATDKGFLPPRMSTADRNAISSPAVGLTIYNNEVKCLQWYDGTGWFNACDGTTDLPPIASGPCAGEPQEIVFNELTYKPIASSGKCWLDRNLGATRVATNRNDADAFGHLYQWGRGNDGHQLRTSGSTARPTPQTSLAPGNTFLTGQSDWYTGTNARWFQITQENNPCPLGYRVPIYNTEWQVEVASWNTTIYDRRERAFQSPLKLPVNGLRQTNGVIPANPGFGAYWSSADAVRPFAFAIRIFDTFIDDQGENIANGFAVRCIKE